MARVSYSGRAGLTMFLLVWSLIFLVTASANEGEKLQAVTEGDDVTLNCYTGKIKDVSEVTVEWRRSDLIDTVVLFFSDGRLRSSHQHPSFKNRVNLTDELKNGNLSMILRNTTLSDSGVYECYFVGETARRKRSITGTDPIKTIDLKVKETSQKSPESEIGGDPTETGERTRPGLTVGLAVFAVFAVFAAVLGVFLKFRKRQNQKEPTESSEQSVRLSV